MGSLFVFFKKSFDIRGGFEDPLRHMKNRVEGMIVAGGAEAGLPALERAREGRPQPLEKVRGGGL